MPKWLSTAGWISLFPISFGLFWWAWGLGVAVAATIVVTMLYGLSEVRDAVATRQRVADWEWEHYGRDRLAEVAPAKRLAAGCLLASAAITIVAEVFLWDAPWYVYVAGVVLLAVALLVVIKRDYTSGPLENEDGTPVED